GIARLFETSGSPSQTKTGDAMGTPAFMPPEQALGEWARVDARTDIWAVGATMFTLLSGRYVHQAETVQRLMLRAMSQPSPPLASVAPSIPARLAAIVDRALAFEQKDRFASAREMQRELNAVDEAAPTLPSPDGAPGPTIARPAEASSAPVGKSTGR